MIIISGQAKRETILTNYNLPLRQLGDQEVDIVSMVNFILDVNQPDECSVYVSDFNDDGSVNIIDVVAMVDIIVNGRTNNYATLVKFQKSNSYLHSK